MSQSQEHLSTLRTAAAGALDRMGVLASARRLRLRAALLLDARHRRLNAADRRRFQAFDRTYGPIVSSRVAIRPSKTALVVSSRCPSIEAELCVIRALQVAGFRVVVLLEDERAALAAFYRVAGVEAVHFWSEWLSSRNFSSEARSMATRCHESDALMRVTWEGVRVGMIAVCTVLRRRYVGSIDWQDRVMREAVVRGLAASMASVDETRRMLDVVRPALVVTEPEYTPKGELFEVCLQRGLDVIAYDSAHRADALMFKRYRMSNCDQHWTTLSAESWTRMRSIEWTPERRNALDQEIADVYGAGDWYGTISSTAAERLMDPIETRMRLGLNDGRKTAFIFPHVLWDAPVMWGRPLFDSYQEWFVETVAAACRNADVRWVIKIHPAHVRKQADEGYRGEAAETRVLRERLGSLPSHVTVLPADTPISTRSLFPVMDYCLTVRGTVGVEAARDGIPVLTAGSARYAELGFTIDSTSRREYLDRLAHLDQVPRLSPSEHELAERFAFGLFLARPCRLTSVQWHDAGRRGRPPVDQEARLMPRNADDWSRAPDVTAMAAWFGSSDEDFLNAGVVSA